MSKTKKVLLMCATYVLVIALAIGGTLAYLTDRDSKVNTFTVGDVEIELIEKFEQGAELLPGVEITKNVQIKNIGDNNAYVWFTYAVPTALVDKGNNASKNVIHLNVPGRYWNGYHTDSKYWTEGQTEAVADDDTWLYDASTIQHNVTNVEKGVDYTVVTWMYKGAIIPGEITNIGLEKVYLDPHIDIAPNGDWYWVNDGGDAVKLDWNTEENGAPKIYVSAYAIQADGITDVNTDGKIDVKDAHAAYNKQWGDKGTEYGPTELTEWELLEISEGDVTRSNQIAKEYVEICHKGGNLTLNNVTFENGLTIYNNDVDNNGTVTFKNCTIYLSDGQSANQGYNQCNADYGLNLNLANGSDITFKFENCTFTAKSGHSYRTDDKGYNVYIGGGYSAESITFDKCTFSGSGKHGIGCSSTGDSQYYKLTVTGCNFINWNNNPAVTNGAAIRGNLPSGDFNADITISGNTFGESNGSTQSIVAIDSWNGSWS